MLGNGEKGGVMFVKVLESTEILGTIDMTAKGLPSTANQSAQANRLVGSSIRPSMPTKAAAAALAAQIGPIVMQASRNALVRGCNCNHYTVKPLMNQTEAVAADLVHAGDSVESGQGR